MRFHFPDLRRRLGIVGLTLLAGGTAVPAAQAVDFAPHRAVYDMELSATRGTGSASAIDGLMEFTWRDVCDGWSIDYKSRMRVTFPERGTRDLSWRYNAWESDDGTRLRFFLRRLAGGQEILRTEGKARLTPGEGGTATYSAPAERTVDLPADTLFPKTHTEEIVRTAADGGTLLWRHVFDGTGENSGLFGASAAVLKEIAANTDLPIESSLLSDTRSWRISLAYFPAEAQESTPESEQTMRLFENGVAGPLTIDYGDFVVTAELTELEALERPDCD